MFPLPDWAPNAHPLFVHFPIALLFSAALFDLIALVTKDREGFRVTAGLTYALGAVAAFVTYLTGDAAADSLSVPVDVQTLLTDHSDWALRTVWFYGLYGVLRLVLLRFRATRLWMRTAVFLIGGLGLFLVVATGERGAEMVFEHGIGVQAAANPDHDGHSEHQEEDGDHHDHGDHDEGGEDDHHHDQGEDDSHDMSRDESPVHDGTQSVSFKSSEDGSWSWLLRNDAADVLKDRAAFIQGSVSDLNATGSDSALTLRLSGEPVLFTLGGALENIQADVSLNLDEFHGTAKLVHHVKGMRDYGFVAVEKATITNGRMSSGETSSLDSDDFSAKGWISLSLVSDGRHTRGYVGDKLRVHGHGEPPDPGPVGLYFEGTGTVQIRRLGATVLKR